MGAGYYLGARVGLALRLPNTTPSVLWPPNAILAATLLLTPPREWAIYLLAVLPSHLITESAAGWSLSLILSLYVTNCSEALLAAVGVRLFSDAPDRFDTFRRFGIFVGAVVIVAPFLSTFPDAAAVNWFHGDPYWRVWIDRFVSNVTGAIAITPAILAAVTGAPLIRQASRRQLAEAGLFLASLAVICLLVLGHPFYSGVIAAVSMHGPFVLLLPVMLWAAVRLGPRGASLTLLITTLWVVWLAAHSVTFSSPSRNDAVNALQLTVISVSVPLLGLSVLIEERERAKRALEERLRFEELVSRLSRDFVGLRSAEIRDAFEASLAQVGTFLDLDGLLIFGAADNDLALMSSWRASGVMTPSDVVMRRDLPWTFERVFLRRTELTAEVADLPGAAAPDKAWLSTHGFRAVVAVPLVADNAVIGALLSFSTRPFRRDSIAGRRLTAEVFANALARCQADEALRATELETERIRAELAHVTRVSTLGTLTASLAHQLYQPLTGILANAQAARRLLAAQPADLAEVRSSLNDIIDDNHRASEVIGRIRELLRKDEPNMRVLDLNDVVRNVTKLMGSDASMRNVSVTLDLEPGPLLIRGDRVQLQQIVLNLLLNAIEAFDSRQDGDRRVRIRTSRTATTAQISVADTGPGFPDGSGDLAFEPFYTTKPAGLGMGLEIARSIVATHHGSIRATNGSNGGAVVEVRLPALESGTR